MRYSSPSLNTLCMKLLLISKDLPRSRGTCTHSSSSAWSFTWKRVCGFTSRGMCTLCASFTQRPVSLWWKICAPGVMYASCSRMSLSHAPLPSTLSMTGRSTLSHSYQ